MYTWNFTAPANEWVFAHTHKHTHAQHSNYSLNILDTPDMPLTHHSQAYRV